MEPETHINSKPPIGTLVSGIISDARNLFVQELKLARKEFSEDVKKTLRALSAMAAGLVALAMSAGLLLLTLVHLLNAMTELPLWACYGLVGLVVGIIGVVFLIIGKNRGQQVDFTPEEAAQAVREDIGWIKARLTSAKIAREREPLSARR